MSNTTATDELWTVDQVSTFLKIPKQTLYQWRSKGYGPEGRRVGKYVRYEPDEVRAWFKAQKRAA